MYCIRLTSLRTPSGCCYTSLTFHSCFQVISDASAIVYWVYRPHPHVVYVTVVVLGGFRGLCLDPSMYAKASECCGTNGWFAITVYCPHGLISSLSGYFSWRVSQGRGVRFIVLQRRLQTPVETSHVAAFKVGEFFDLSVAFGRRCLTFRSCINSFFTSKSWTHIFLLVLCHFGRQ